MQIDPRYNRPTEVDCLLGQAEKARRELGWQAVVRWRRWCAKWLRRTCTRRAPTFIAFPKA